MQNIKAQMCVLEWVLLKRPLSLSLQHGRREDYNTGTINIQTSFEREFN